jgi:hypothetical protein
LVYVIRDGGKHWTKVTPPNMSVPEHPQVARGTLRALIAKAGLTVQEFLSAARWLFSKQISRSSYGEREAHEVEEGLYYDRIIEAAKVHP